ncbi:MAG: iron-containing alcohol dehydrogenase [Oscillospiraceae bacterium]|nr:iron-containing alcohol dehydrogenase [Oscillospiraceae bacterium]
MKNVTEIIKDFEKKCSCGVQHRTTVQDVQIGSGLVNCVGEILKKNNFPENILIVADKDTLNAAKGIEESLKDFSVEYKVYNEIRVADMTHVEELEDLVNGKNIGILSVGTGSVNDPCRLAAARQNKMLCIFGTAPSMDGFASYSSPILKDGFKASYPAKSPEVIIGDTKILASAPTYLKSAGFGDMVAKYIGLVDWKISNILTGEYYCERVAKLTRDAVDKLMSMADRVTENDEETAGEIFKSLLMTGIGMSFTQNSRPASGSEHIIAHLVECVQLRDGIIPNYHGEDIGVFTLLMLKYYNCLAEKETVTAKKEKVNWEDVYAFYGEMADDVKKVNEPETVTDRVDPKVLEDKWQEIREVIKSVPSYDQVYTAMKKAGCKLTVQDIGKPQKLVNDCIKYSPYMRYRLTLLRLKDMIE